MGTVPKARPRGFATPKAEVLSAIEPCPLMVDAYFYGFLEEDGALGGSADGETGYSAGGSG